MTDIKKEKEQVRLLVTEAMKMFFERNYSADVVISSIENIIASIGFNCALDSGADPYSVIDELAANAKGHVKFLEECKSGKNAEEAGVIEVVQLRSETVN